MNVFESVLFSSLMFYHRKSAPKILKHFWCPRDPKFFQARFLSPQSILESLLRMSWHLENISALKIPTFRKLFSEISSKIQLLNPQHFFTPQVLLLFFCNPTHDSKCYHMTYWNVFQNPKPNTRFKIFLNLNLNINLGPESISHEILLRSPLSIPHKFSIFSPCPKYGSFLHVSNR